MISLNDIATKNENWPRVLDTLLPGGENWERYKKTRDCLTSCPGYKDCNKGRSVGLVCSENWRKAEGNPLILYVLRHVLENFPYYDRDDCQIKEKEKEVKQLLSEINRWAARNPRPVHSI